MTSYYRETNRRDHRGRRRRRREHRRKQFNDYRDRKRHGWGMGLYRNRRDGKICGVAAGLADYWDVADWVVRLMFIGAFIFTGTLAIWAYVAGCILLSPRPDDRSGRSRRRRRERRRAEAEDSFASARDEADFEAKTEARAAAESANEDETYGPEMEYDERYGDYRPRRMFRYSEGASVRLARARERLDAAVKRVEDMESYVTSRRFKLNREFSRL